MAILHIGAGFTVIFMLFDLNQTHGLLNWILVLFLSVSYTFIPILTCSWVRFYYKDDILQSFSLYGAFYGLMKIAIMLMMQGGSQNHGWQRVAGVLVILAISVGVWLTGLLRPRRVDRKADERRLWE